MEGFPTSHVDGGSFELSKKALVVMSDLLMSEGTGSHDAAI